MYINVCATSVSVLIFKMIIGHCDSQHNGSLILFSYLGHTISSSNTLPNIFTYLLNL